MRTQHTSADSPRTIDYIALNPDGIDQPISSEEAYRLKRFHTDHYAVEAKFTFGLPDSVSSHYPLTLNQERLAQNDYELHSQIPVIESPSNTFNSHRG